MAKAHRFAPVIAHINEKLGERIEADELYRLAGLSHSQFSEAFRGAFGVSATRYIQDQPSRPVAQGVHGNALANASRR
jgi:AraC-like DNA-binding protein